MYSRRSTDLGEGINGRKAAALVAIALVSALEKHKYVRLERRTPARQLVLIIRHFNFIVPAQRPLPSSLYRKCWPLWSLLLDWDCSRSVLFSPVGFGCLVLLIRAFAKATAAVTTSPIPGYAVQEVAWEVQATPGGPYLRLNGTVQEVFNQLRQVNPTFDTDFGIDLDSSNRRTRITTSSANSKYQVESNTCLPDRDTANLDIILNEGIPYLRSVPGQPGESGRGVCGRVSCSWKSAIWWCIDVSLMSSFFLLIT